MGDTPTASQHNIFDSEKFNLFFLVLLTRRDSNLSPMDLESNALRIEPPRHPIIMINVFFFFFIELEMNSLRFTQSHSICTEEEKPGTRPYQLARGDMQ